MVVLVLWKLVHNQQVEFLHVEVFTIAEAPGTVVLITVEAEKAVLMPRYMC